MGGKGGLDCHLAVDGIDLTGDTGSIDSLSTPRGTYQKTGLDDDAMVRIYGRKDFMCEFTSYFNTDAGQAHASWKTLPTTDRHAMVTYSGLIGGSGYGTIAKQLNYDGTRPEDGDFTLKVSLNANGYGGDPGRLVTAYARTDTAATNGAGVDFGAATSFGLTAYLQLRAFTGTSVTAKLQESSDNGVGDAWADVTGGAFTAATAIGVQRIQTATNLAVERYLRLVTTGTFSNALFAVLVCKYESLPA